MMIGQLKQHLVAADGSSSNRARFATTVGRLAITAGLADLIDDYRRLQLLFGECHQHDQVAEQASDATTLIELMRLSAVVAAASIVGGARLLGVIAGALAVALPLAFLPSKLQLDSVTITI